jgi:GMP synthase-like glutamine amidotransferase
MSVWEEDRHPWLTAEKRLMEALIAAGKPILGICLGAQMLADVLGARTYRGENMEIGWHRVEATPESRFDPIGEVLPDTFETFLWHGDSFDIPDGAVHLARGALFDSQAFAYERGLALQFHLEVRPEWVRRIAARDAAALDPSEHVQSLETVLGKPAALYRANNAIMGRLLGRWLETVWASEEDAR